jgi:hypothetical protein
LHFHVGKIAHELAAENCIPTGEKLFIQETRFTPPHRTKKLYLPKYKHLEFDGSNIAHQLPAERVFPSTSNKGVLISKIREIALRLQIKMFPTAKIQANAL